jgi:hypothetical protein
MRHYTCVGHSLAHVHHGIHNRSWDVHALRHHHSSSILHHGTHFGATCISRAHMHTTTNSGTKRVAGSIKSLWRNTHILHYWAHCIAHGFKCGTHIATVSHRALKGLHSVAQRSCEGSRICGNCIHNFLRHFRHRHWKHHRLFSN